MTRARLLMTAAVTLIGVAAFANDGYTPLSSRRPNPPASEVRLLVPAFGGESVGVSVSTILNLQVWQTLRIPQSGPGRNTSGVVVWSGALPKLELDAAASSANATAAQLVLWGEAVPYADGTLVQAFLTLPPQDSVEQEWRIRLLDEAKVPHSFTVDLPSRHYQFEPIVLSNKVVEQYRTPADLKIYSAPAGGAVKGSIGVADFRALEHSGDTVKVKVANGPSGWLQLPKISAERSEVVDFTAGVIRILRQDWSGAKRMFDSVIQNRRTPTAVRIDAHLLRAQASLNSGGDWRSDLAAAMRLNPYDTDTLSYAMMFHLAAAVDAPSSSPARRSAVRVAVKIADENRLLFADDDPLIAALREYAASR